MIGRVIVDYIVEDKMVRGLNFTTEDLNRHTYDACQKTLKKANAKHYKDLLKLKNNLLEGIAELNLKCPYMDRFEIDAMIEKKFEEWLI